MIYKTPVLTLALMLFSNAVTAVPATLDEIKTSMNGVTGTAVSKLGTGSALGQINGNYVECDSDGNCVDTGTLSLNASDLAGEMDNSFTGSPTDGVNSTYTSTITIEITCQIHQNYTLASGVMIKISGCATDHDKNVYELKAARCNKVFSSEGCYNENTADWSIPKTFTKTSAQYINNQTIQLESDVTATISCRPRSYICDLTAQVRTELSGSAKELGEQANATNTSDDYAISGNQISRNISDDPTYQDFNDGLAADYADCVKNTTFDKASDGYLLSCDGAERVDITSECTEVITCIQEQDTIITSVARCDAYIPLAYQTCRIDIPSGSCEVFLEHTEQVCDNITPNGECVKELVNAMQICETFIPNGTCNNELVVSQPACVFSIPEGSCNMEKVISTTTCTNTVKQGECNRELETFVKTCDVDVEETKDCVETIDVTESDCNAVAAYTTQACESTRDVSEHNCSIKYTLTTSSTPGCSGTYTVDKSSQSSGCGTMWYGIFTCRSDGKIDYTIQSEHVVCEYYDGYGEETDTIIYNASGTVNSSTFNITTYGTERSNEGTIDETESLKSVCSGDDCTITMGYKTLGTIPIGKPGSSSASVSRTSTCTNLDNA